MTEGLDGRTLVQRLVELLRERIIKGDLVPGTNLRQEEYAEAFGISRTPLREAFRILEAEGWLISRPRAGVEVASFSFEEITEIATMRMLYEPLAARATASRHSAGDEKSLARVLATIDRRPSGISRSDHIDGVTRAFHFGIYALAPTGVGDTPFQREMRTYWERYARYRRVYWNAEKSVHHSDDEHHAILDAWCAGDADAVEVQMARHIFTALLSLIGSLAPGADLPPELVELAVRYNVEPMVGTSAQS